jgi:hypothetical protein
MRDGNCLLALLRGHYAVVVDVSVEWDVQEEQHNLCGKRNEDHVDTKLVERAGKARKALLRDTVAGRA